MSWKSYAVLGVLGLSMALFVASFQVFPGYMDSDYYFAGGMQLAMGKGFNEPYIWNYLDNPSGLPHPSHSYWMPLASILTALGMQLTGSTGYASGRMAFIALAALVPVATARLALSFSQRAFPAMVSGLLAVFSIYYVPFLPVPDNYGIYLVLGAMFMLGILWNRALGMLAIGMIAGIMTLARTDGVLWLALGILGVIMRDRSQSWFSASQRKEIAGSYRATAVRLALVATGFLIVVMPWVARNLQAYGAVRAPGADRLLWLTTYDEVFAYPPDILTGARWWDQGVQNIAAARLAALRWNLLNAMAAQGGVFLLPFILIGAWQHRHDPRVRLGAIGWLTLLGGMTLVLPQVGARGGWFHSGAGLQALWWSLAPLGLERVVASARERRLFSPQAHMVFGVAMVCIAAVMTAYIFFLRVTPGWGEGEDQYAAVDARLIEAGARKEDVVMVRNPPGYYVMTGRSAIAVPYSDSAGMLLAARRFGAGFLVIEAAGAAGPIRAVYDDLASQSFEFLGEEDGTRIFRILP